jgi:hypothetical protein
MQKIAASLSVVGLQNSLVVAPSGQWIAACPSSPPLHVCRQPAPANVDSPLPEPRRGPLVETADHGFPFLVLLGYFALEVLPSTIRQ